MEAKFIICSTRDELYHLDQANLMMNGATILDSLNKAYQPMLEGDISCLIVTDKIIETQSTYHDMENDLKTLFRMHPKRYRIIYIKQGIVEDTISTLLDSEGMWDVYYNTQLQDIRTEDILEMVSRRKVKERRFSDALIRDSKQTTLHNADVLAQRLLEILRDNPDPTTNHKFATVVSQNLHLIRDLILAFEEVKKISNLKTKDLQQLKSVLSTMSIELKTSKETIFLLEESHVILDDNNKTMLDNLRLLETKYNSLYNMLSQAAEVSEANSLLSNAIDVDEYRDQAPLVIYFKEYTSLQYFTHFLDKFSQIAGNSLMMLTKVLVIENDFHVAKIPLYRDKKFVHVNDGTNMSNMVLGNLVSVGFNRKLMNYLLHNSLKLDLLLVYDRTGVQTSLLTGANLIKFNLVKNLSDAYTLGLIGGTVPIITNDKNGDYVLSEIPDYNKISANESLETSVFAGLDITKRLLTFIDSWTKVEAPLSDQILDLGEDEEEEVMHTPSFKED